MNMYRSWLENKNLPGELRVELLGIRDDEKAVSDRFYRDLEFGTGGLRGKMGAGTNRMNVFTVAKATRGLAKYLKMQNALPSCAISFDSRINSPAFAKLAAATLAKEGVRVYLYSELAPTPMLSFAVRYLYCDGGIMITASHNPKEYNGYKVYGKDGCQISGEAADEISACIAKESDLLDEMPDFEAERKRGNIIMIDHNVYDAYENAVLEQGVYMPSTAIKVVYSPLNGAGLKTFMRVMAKLPNVDITVVEEQEEPDGNFPTCPSPNPENKEAMALAIALTKKIGADICLATDPDSDRVGVGVLKDGEVSLLSGNQVGVLLMHFLIEARKAQGTMPENPLVVKTIVSTMMADAIAKEENVQVKNVLTGFKYIGEQIALLEREGRKSSYIFGFEESCGYLSGSYVRDKDAINACLLILQMTSFYKQSGQTLLDAYQDLCKRFGYFETTQLNFSFDGQEGQRIMQDLMAKFRNLPSEGELAFEKKTDYWNDETGLPKSDVLVFDLKEDRQFIVRPSGTEPKIKIYVSAKGETSQQAKEKLDALSKSCREFVESLTK